MGCGIILANLRLNSYSSYMGHILNRYAKQVWPVIFKSTAKSFRISEVVTGIYYGLMYRNNKFYLQRYMYVAISKIIAAREVQFS